MESGPVKVSQFRLLQAVFLLFAVMVGTVPAAVAAPTARIAAADQQRIEARLEATGRARVIVRVTSPGLAAALVQTEPERPTPVTAAQRALIDQGQRAVEQALVRQNSAVLRRFKHIPYMALEVDAAALDQLLQSDVVAGIEEDSLHRLVLASSGAAIGADILRAEGFTGGGMAVAILDSGVDTGHSFLSGGIVSEACFSSTYAPQNASTLCPNGADQQLGTGAGVNCSPTLTGCDHGTHVAGIAAGNGLTGGVSYSGVARDAGIVAIQVFSQFDDGSGPYIAAYTSDIVAGLSRVLELQQDPGFTPQIVAANLSLGGTIYSSSDACDAARASTKAIIDQLRVAGVATVVASGNESQTGGIAAPGCISSAVSVGATFDSDVIPSFSNSASWLSLLAPGVGITSSVPGGSYASKNGTSMATPQVTGAFAALRSAAEALRPGAPATVDETLAALGNLGIQVTDPRNGFAVPRIQLDAAASAFDQCLLPAADLVVDSGYVDVGTSTISGAFAVAGSAAYYRGKTLQGNTAGVDSFRFTPSLQYAGDYRVYAWWAANPANTAQASYTIRHAAGLSVANIDQRAGGGKWHALGVFRLAADGTDYVEVSDANDPGATLVADAVRFEFLQTPSLISIDTPSLPSGSPGDPYSVALATSCAQAPLTWSLLSGQLPLGLRLDPSTGEISGTPSGGGASNFTVQVVDAGGNAATRGYLLLIDGVMPLDVDTTVLPDGAVGTAYGATLTASGGTPPYSWSVVGGALPAGVALAGDGSLSGTPNEAGVFGVTVQVTDDVGTTANKALSLTVTDPGAAVFFDDFEDGTLAPWSTLGSGQVQVVNTTDGWVLRKSGSNDPNGGWAPLGTSVGDFELVLYTRKVDSAGGAANRYSVTDGSGNGYGAYLQFDTSELVLERRNAWATVALGAPAAISGGLVVGQWYTLQVRREGGQISTSVYAGRVDPAGATPIAQMTASDTSHASFTQVNVNGGQSFDTDDLWVIP